MVDNWMGPNPLWLMEWLCSALDLPAGARVLDLGCGKALTSIFLAREYGVRVVAADLWIPPHENWARVKEANCADSVMPVFAEAHDLKLANEYFDAIVSVDAYHYFGTDELYLAYLSRFLAPGGRIGIVVPGLVAELADNQVPEHLEPYWQPDFWTFHSPMVAAVVEPKRRRRGRTCRLPRRRLARLGAVVRGLRRGEYQ